MSDVPYSKELILFKPFPKLSDNIYLCTRKSSCQCYRNQTMNTSTIPTDKDPMGRAIMDYHQQGRAGRLRVFSSQFEEDEIPVKHLFRQWDEMPPLERKALELAQGRILDIGAGSGCHSIYLQKAGKEVVSIDISPLAIQVMKARGLHDVRLTNLFDEKFCDTFDTIYMLMNGSGIVGQLKNLPYFFQRMKRLLNPHGSILMDSSDLRYIFEDENGSFAINLADKYYGEVDFCMQYEDVIGEPFDWLYIDFQTLSYYAAENGFCAELIHQGEHYDYLARLQLKK